MQRENDTKDNEQSHHVVCVDVHRDAHGAEASVYEKPRRKVERESENEQTLCLEDTHTIEERLNTRLNSLIEGTRERVNMTKVDESVDTEVDPDSTQTIRETSFDAGHMEPVSAGNDLQTLHMHASPHSQEISSSDISNIAPDTTTLEVPNNNVNGSFSSAKEDSAVPHIPACDVGKILQMEVGCDISSSSCTRISPDDLGPVTLMPEHSPTTSDQMMSVCEASSAEKYTHICDTGPPKGTKTYDICACVIFISSNKSSILVSLPLCHAWISERSPGKRTQKYNGCVYCRLILLISMFVLCTDARYTMVSTHAIILAVRCNPLFH